MPPRWPREPDRRDPAYRKLDDRMNFAFHVALSLAINSGLWFVHNFNRRKTLSFNPRQRGIGRCSYQGLR